MYCIFSVSNCKLNKVGAFFYGGDFYDAFALLRHNMMVASELLAFIELSIVTLFYSEIRRIQRSYRCCMGL